MKKKKTYEHFEDVGLFLLKGAIGAVFAGTFLSLIGVTGRCLEAYDDNIELATAMDFLEKENNELKEEIKKLTNKVVETITDVKESVEA